MRGLFSAILFVFNTLFWCCLLYPLIFLKALIPIPSFRREITRPMIRIGESWISGNSWNISLTQNIDWEIHLPEGLSLEKSYLVIANHQSWMDIVIIQHVFNRKIPFLRFFLKKELLYVPLLGLAWWALDYPFMKRHSKEYLQKHPEKRGEDLKTTQKTIARFKDTPVAILNFLEGTRWTPAKHLQQKPPFQHLLNPKAGGLAFALEAMKDHVDSVLDVTIIYPQGAVSLLQAFSGHLQKVIVHVRRIPLTTEMKFESEMGSVPKRGGFKKWVMELWQEKDLLIQKVLLSDRGNNSPTP